ncbi:hypothetical protein [Flavobacterium lindanitolerans]|uniref:TMF family protein n=1 Tax=Flavobacterium lindanitolerans TaxID=428988 RepID=A0A497VGP3_9FLAO|nr:hypothetical protein [Flavobacterium lindanitolerans]MBC8643635.1 hypothetical protein [Flavobacterium lindanitolerans]PKW28612.1 hypothetical protein B0G92_0235 [Flavobacterium lindanitolerans]RLJ35883.1 hypothetical protein CLV50_1269 [Flavobacterium lindanitolerans]
MKLKQIAIPVLLLFGLAGHSQNVASTANLTSGGYQAGTAGNYNTYYGSNTGENNSSGTNNTFLGNIAGKSNTSGSQNIFIGSQSGFQNKTGTGNIYLGHYAGGEIESGNNNTFIGANAGGEAHGSNNVYIGAYAGYYENLDNQLRINNSFGTTPLIWGDFNLDQLKFNGKVGIGNGFGSFPSTAGSVNVSNYNLFVKGGILTEEVRVNLQGDWADYVFDKNYNLKPLEEVETFIKENGHLENVPSAKQVKENGIELGEIAKIQQEKIEELTLYLIELNKENKVLQKKLLELEEKINNSNTKN